MQHKQDCDAAVDLFSCLSQITRAHVCMRLPRPRIHEAKKRRATQVITCSFPCGKGCIWLEHGQANGASVAEEWEDTDKERLNTCRKKQWRKFKAQGVKRKRRASLGLTTGVGSIFSVPSTSMGRRNVISNSSGKAKTDSWSHYGEKRK